MVSLAVLKHISKPHYKCEGLFIIIFCSILTVLFQLYKSGNWDHYIAEISEVYYSHMGEIPLKLCEHNAAKKA